MKRLASPAWLLAAPLLAALGWAAAPARADLPPQELSAAYREECGACHVAYPPALLPAASWQRLMAGLDRHFGVDASLDPAAARAIGDWLGARAGSYKKVRREVAPPPQDRITRATWFGHKHRKVPAATWQRPDVRSPANCNACHGRAPEGLYDERDIRIPR